jgi:glycosyltransferase involved in cell wall biosynthesis
MIFLAGSLDMNGGSTFLLRFAREMFASNKKIDIVVLNSVVDEKIKIELEQFSNVINLNTLVDYRFAWCGTNQAAIFYPFNRTKIEQLLEDNNRAVHAMGVFGLVYAYRLARQFGHIKISAGVYQQNEFLCKSSLFFVRHANKMFASLPAENIVFFNEYNQETYSQFFKKNYSNSALLPIGVSLPKIEFGNTRKFDYGRLVSVGNLVDFKTYNEHVIRVVALLSAEYPSLRYDIYGEGDQQDFLDQLIKEHGLDSVVSIHKRIPYSDFKSTVEHAMGFIGSGTAILEAAALQVPSITGIESIKTPETYGFLSDVKGYSYNEFIVGMKLISIRDVVLRLLNSDPKEIQHIGEECATKAAEFSIEKTVQGFSNLQDRAKFVTVKLSLMFRICFHFSFLLLVILDVLNIDRKFRMRRDQNSPLK